MGGTVIYMPPEEYEPSKARRADVKHDMYRWDNKAWLGIGWTTISVFSIDQGMTCIHNFCDI